MRTTWLISFALAGCAVTPSGPVGLDPDEISGDGKADAGIAATPDVRCASAPDAGPKRSFRHFSSKVISKLGSAVHRGFDMVASADAETQTLGGALSYNLGDKALEDEEVDVFACRAGAWKRIATVVTDDEGRFTLELAGDRRLPIGLRDMFVSVAGDRSGVRFLAYVGATGAQLIVSDVDGTLTSSKGAFLQTILVGRDPSARAGAPAAYQAAKARGYQLVYVTARGQQNTEATRGWLERKGFPRGPVRLAPGLVTLPGSDTVEYKTTTLQALGDSGLEVAAGVGNRASDVKAYAAAGLPADRIFIERPEFAGEVQPEIDAGRAIGFDTYDELRATQIETLPAL